MLKYVNHGAVFSLVELRVTLQDTGNCKFQQTRREELRIEMRRYLLQLFILALIEDFRCVLPKFFLHSQEEYPSFFLQSSL
jgi:hypothetical protein